MRHGARGSGVDAPLAYYDYKNLEASCPEVWRTIAILAPLSLDRIVFSPYLRTRQTAMLVQYGIYKYTGRLIPLVVDTRIGEYLRRRCSWKAQASSEFDSETSNAYHGRVPLCREAPEYFLRRVHNFYQEQVVSSQRTLAITHFSVAEVVGSFYSREVSLAVGACTLLTTEAVTQMV